jgi:hypothetical protein
MTGQDLIALSVVVEPWLRAGAIAGFLVLLADWFFRRQQMRTEPALDAPLSPHQERRLLLLVVGIGTLLRFVDWDGDATPPFWWAETSTLYVDRILREGTFSSAWLRTFRLTQVADPHQSAFVLPVHAGLQALMGPRFGLPVLVGASFGSLAIPLAWALGRRVRSPAFGLAFAMLVACSPIMLTWSRLSALCIASVSHVLLAMLVGWEAGRRGSVVLALAAGVVAWTSVYLYYAARLGIPLAIAALMAGAQRVQRLRRGILLALVAAIAFLATAWTLHGRGFALTALWPDYTGYAGNKGERTVSELLSQNAASVVRELWHTVERCFADRRTGWQSEVWLPGMANGGLWIVPVALLGIVGLVSTLRHARHQWLWLALGAVGLALPAFSAMTSRRTLVLDLAWCAFAAHGLFAVVDTLGARAVPATRRRLAAFGVGLIASWSVAAVFALDAALPRGGGQHIPFGDAGFGDGVTCRRCLEAARTWRDEMADGAFVVLFDNDVFRENRTSPGGLIAYGKIAPLVAATPDRFVEAYSLMAGIDDEPPLPGRVFDPASTDFVTHLQTQIERTRPKRIVWHFERPTSWERWLAGRLAAAGGTQDTFATPLSPTHGIRVATPWAQRAGAFAVLRDLVTGLAPDADSPCISLTARDGFEMSSPPFLVAGDGSGLDAPPVWLATSFDTHRYASLDFVAPLPIGAVVTPSSETTPRRIDLVGRFGQRVLFDLPSLARTDLPGVADGSHGLNCATYADGHWWVLDAWTGAVTSAHPGASSVPKGDWIGIASDPSGALVLASGSQTIAVFDPQRQTEIARFPARVSPSVRVTTDECTPLAVGAHWIAIADLRTSVLSVYDRTGRDLGTRRLDRELRVPLTLTTIGGVGQYLAVGIGTMVRIFELRIDRDCPVSRPDGASDGRRVPSSPKRPS